MISRKGFTLMELLVVVIIIGILAAVGIPHYHKTVETTKAGDAVAVASMLANAYRMFVIDNSGVAISGQITAGCGAGLCSTADTTSCRLVRCKYVAEQDWATGAYNYFVGAASCGGALACARRNGGIAPYNTWGYNMSAAGVCSPVGAGTPSCPSF